MFPGLQRTSSAKGRLRGCGEPLASRGSVPFPARERAVPWRAHPPALRSPSSFVRRSPRGDVWGDRGAVAVPRVVRWRTVEPVSVGVYGSRHSREESFRRYPHHEHYRAALNNNDVPGTAAAYTQAPNTLVPIFLHIYFFSKLNPIASWIGSNCWYRFTIPIDAYKKRNTRP